MHFASLIRAIVVAGAFVLVVDVSAQDPLKDSSERSYVLSAEDTILVRVPETEEFVSEKSSYRIDNDGYVNLPLVGRWRAAGLTSSQLEQQLTERLKNWYLHPRVYVSVAELRSQPVSVLGSVNTPGLQHINGRETIVEALSRAGGPRLDAGPTLTLTRHLEYGQIPLTGAKDDPTGKFSVVELKVVPIVSGEDAADNLALQPHDVITVSRAQMIYVLGEVNKSGAFVLNDQDQMSALKAVALAGGLSRNAASSSARVLRRRPGSSARVDIPLNLPKLMRNKNPDMILEPEDILFVPDNVTKRIAGRTIEAAITIGSGLAIWRVAN